MFVTGARSPTWALAASGTLRINYTDDASEPVRPTG